MTVASILVGENRAVPREIHRPPAGCWIPLSTPFNSAKPFPSGDGERSAQSQGYAQWPLPDPTDGIMKAFVYLLRDLK